MSFREIIGHDAPIDLLRRAVRSGRLPHALLFHGPEGVGKGTVARALAAAVLCERASEGDACGGCAACTKLRHGNHPDLLVVRRLPKKVVEAGTMSDADPEHGGGTDLSPFIRLFQVRQLAEHSAYAPREGSHRVFLVDPADRMNTESQNALLKTLEEPPGRSLLVLIASRPHLLLSTVRSRCLSVGFAPLPVPALAERLEARGLAPREAAERAALAGGCPGRALDLDVESLRARREQILSAVTALASSPQALADLPEWSRGVLGDGEEEFLEGLDLLETLLRDAARAVTAGSSEPLAHADLAAPLRKLGGRIGAVRAGRLVEATERLRGELRFNLNRTLATESLLAAIAGGPLP